MATRTFTGTGNFSTAARWDGGLTTPSAGDILVISGACTVFVSDATGYGDMSVTNGNSISLGNNTLTVGFITHDGTISIGTSVGNSNGLLCNGWTSSATAIWTINSNSYINCYGNITEVSGVTYTDFSGSGRLSLQANCNYASENTSHYWNAFYLGAGYTCTITGAQTKPSLTNTQSSGSTVINGTLNVGTKGCSFGVLTAGTGFQIGANGDIQGSGQIDCHFINTNAAVYANARSSALSYTGQWTMPSHSFAAQVFFPIDVSNGSARITLSVTNSFTVTIVSGTLKCKSFLVSGSGVTGTIVIDCATYNPSFEISGDLTINPAVSTGSFTWNKGTGTFTLLGSTIGTITLGYQLNAVTVNTSSTKSLATAMSVVSFTMTAGTLNSSVAGTQRSITATNVTLTAGTIKDIALSSTSYNAYNGKTVTNGGNNKGVVFKDTLKTVRMNR